ncbi:MAG: phospho-N-acetylmuramoyl-pentapeptide-transferase [Saccharofermentanales bacterium]
MLDISKNAMEITLWRMIQLMGLPSFLFTFFATLIIGAVLIPVLRRLAVGQQVREDGPQTHLSKSGTPTFGGIMFLLPLLAFGICAPMIPVFSFLKTEGAGIPPLTAAAVFMFLSGAVGFVDDYIKVRVRKNGLSAIAKSIMLLVVITGFTVYYLYYSGIEPYFLLPFTDLSQGGTPFVLAGAGKLVYGLIIIAVLYFTGNSVNITDGVDGLAASVTAIVSIFLGIMGASIQSEYSLMASFFTFAIAGACLAFFLYNRHPAKLFMGDTGSQALGAAVGAAAVISGIFWILIPVGIIYVMESLSVVIQVWHYKRTHERVFRMAPLHHHFELGGWSEWKVIAVFCFVSLIGGFVGLWMVL